NYSRKREIYQKTANHKCSALRAICSTEPPFIGNGWICWRTDSGWWRRVPINREQGPTRVAHSTSRMATFSFHKAVPRFSIVFNSAAQLHHQLVKRIKTPIPQLRK